MQQKELAALLDISTAMVSRLVKRGMPTDTIERAERWRKRHLESGRVKGARFGTVRVAARPTAHLKKSDAYPLPPATSAPQPSGSPAVILPNDLSPIRIQAAELAGAASIAIVEMWAQATRQAQASGAECTSDMVNELRALLRRLPLGSKPRMALSMWMELVNHALHEEAEVRRAGDLGTLLDPDGFAICVDAHLGSNLGGWWLQEAEDWEGYGQYGWPLGWTDD